MPPTPYSSAILVSLEKAVPSSFKIGYVSCANVRFMQQRIVLANPENGFMSTPSKI